MLLFLLLALILKEYFCWARIYRKKIVNSVVLIDRNLRKKVYLFKIFCVSYDPFLCSCKNKKKVVMCVSFALNHVSFFKENPFLASKEVNSENIFLKAKKYSNFLKTVSNNILFFFDIYYLKNSLSICKYTNML